MPEFDVKSVPDDRMCNVTIFSKNLYNPDWKEQLT